MPTGFQILNQKDYCKENNKNYICGQSMGEKTDM